MDLFEDTRPGQNAPEFTVSEISGAVKRVIEGEFGRVRVRGEIGRVSRHASGHVYFDLKDERACLGSVAFKSTARALRVQPQEGMEVIATGRLTTFAPASKYQLIVDEIAPAGVGALMAMLEARKKALEAEGLFAAERKRRLPYLPEVIGVVTSPSGAVIRDILHRLRERFPRPVLLWPVTVQGERCAAEVAAAVRGFNALLPGGPVPRPDLLIVARGGGSLEDLWGFNDEAVVRAVAESRIPVISAVGHETDTTLIDFAADRRAPTPTAAAEIAVPVRIELLAATARLEERRRAALARALGQRGQRLRDLSRALPRPEALLAERTQRLDGLGHRLPRALVGYTRELRLRLGRDRAGRFGPALLAVGNERRRARLVRATHGLRADAAVQALGRRAERLEARGRRLDQVERRLTQAAAARLGAATARLAPGLARLDARRERLTARGERLDQVERRLTRDNRALLAALARTLATLSPQEVLTRGYAIVRDAAGAVVTRAEPARRAAGLEIEFADGRVEVRPDRPAPRRRGRPDTADQDRLL
jgi:exodeoxyribonuclease VII large subunit